MHSDTIVKFKRCRHFKRTLHLPVHDVALHSLLVIKRNLRLKIHAYIPLISLFDLFFWGGEGRGVSPQEFFSLMET